MQVKKLEAMFDSDHKWLSNISAILAVGTWTTYANVSAVDHRIYDFFRKKYFDRDFAALEDSDINAAVTDFINSHVYELDSLYATTTATYNPIENYNLTESGRDETRSSSTGSTTDYSTSYNSATENKTGKSEAGGSSSTTLIHSFSRSGNIGVTTTQQMLQSERDIAHFDFIGYVAEMVVTNFTNSQYFPDKDFFEVII